MEISTLLLWKYFVARTGQTHFIAVIPRVVLELNGIIQKYDRLV